MREIFEHQVTPESEGLRIRVVDEPGPGGANHHYILSHDDRNTTHNSFLDFQNGPIKEVGVNGVTQEALLAIVIDRLRSFQAGPFACRDNAVALTKAEESLMWLQKRTRDRMRRGVEGHNIK